MTTNNLTNPKYQALYNLILKSEGRALEDELGEGCKVQFGSDVIKTVIHKTSEGWDCLLPNGLIVEFRSGEIEILGLPISLDRVLRALSRTKPKKPFSYSSHCWIRENFLEIEVVRGVWSGRNTQVFEINWQFRKPLHEQPEVVWERLTDILNK